MKKDSQAEDIASKKPAKKAKKTPKPASERPWNTLGGLVLGTLILYIMAWLGAMHAGETISEFYAKDHARDWARAVVSNFGTKEAVFSKKTLRINDKYVIHDFKKGTNIYRYSLTDNTGWVFASSLLSENASTLDKTFFNNKLKAGKIIAKRSTVPASQVDGYTMRSHVKKLDDNAPREIIEIAVPVFDGKKFVGAVVVYDDITSLLAWSNKQAVKIALILCAAITLIMAAIAVLVWSYGAARIKQSNALKKAKAEAEAAEKDAREMAGQLQVMNDDIGKLNDELRKNVKTLRETQDEVIRKGKMAQLGQLTATVAHDIRNPLGSIRTSTFLLRRKFARENTAMEKPLDRIEKGVERCDGIITELLDFARSKDLSLKDQDLDAWLVGLVTEQAEELPPEVAVECELGMDDKHVPFDVDSMRRAVINFISNASEAMVGKGNERPANPTQNPKISIKSRLNGDRVEISVTDNGPGISPENLKRILDPLFTTKSFGVGLGLPAVEKIFEQHGGGLKIDTVEGKGTTFTGWFPLKPKTVVADDDQEEAA